VRMGRDRLDIDGRAVEQSAKIYLILNKPRGAVTTASDERGRETVYDCLKKNGMAGGEWIAPVGRLDKASEGLLLLTNDSEWAARITAPESHVDKTYHVQAGRRLSVEDVRKLEQGFTVRDGEFLQVKRAKLLREGGKNCWIEIILDEGKNRQIRRMLETLGVEVLRLIRVAIGELKLGELEKGRVRPLSNEEKLLLF
jgi:23S rRNA pseudouridine2605 synthase